MVSCDRAFAGIERGFRGSGEDIDIAPMYRRLPERIRAHALDCFMALVLDRIMCRRLRTNQSRLSPRCALALLRQLHQDHVAVN